MTEAVYEKPEKIEKPIEEPIGEQHETVSCKLYTVIETQKQVEDVCRDIIIRDKIYAISVDFKGVLKDKEFAFIMLCFFEHCYIFDMSKVRPFDHKLPYNLKQILISERITKIVHNFCMSCSVLVNQYGVHCNKVFDT